MYGIIDIGSNTIRLVLYHVEKSKDGYQISRIMNKKYTASLAGYVTKKGKLSGEGIQCASDILCELRAIIESIHLEKVYVFATASFRNIKNTEEVLRRTEAASGFSIRVLSGEEEANCGFYGLMSEIEHAHKGKEVSSGMQIDLGGGSTEFVFFDEHKIQDSLSIPIGSLNLYDRFVDSILPTASEIKQIRKFVMKNLKKADLPEKAASTLLCCEGGTARALKKLITTAFPENIGHDFYNAEYLKEWEQYYLQNPEKCQRDILKINPERIHTVIPGAVAIQCISEYFHCKQILTVRNGVREGYLLSQLFDKQKDPSFAGFID